MKGPGAFITAVVAIVAIIAVVLLGLLSSLRIGYSTTHSLATPLHPCYQIQSVTTEVLRQRLLDGSWSATQACNDGQTLLHIAAFSCDLEGVQLLLDAGASATATDDYGRRPSDIARALSKMENARVLLEAEERAASGGP